MDNALQDLSAIRKDIERLNEPRGPVVQPVVVSTAPIPPPVRPLSRLVPRGGVFLSWRALAALTMLGTAAYWIADLAPQAPGAPAKAPVAAAAPVETPDWSQTWQPARSVQPGRASGPGVSTIATGSINPAAPPAKPPSDAEHHEQHGPRKTYHSREPQQQGRVTRRVLATRQAEPSATSSASRAWTGTFYEK